MKVQLFLIDVLEEMKHKKVILKQTIKNYKCLAATPSTLNQKNPT